MPKHEVVHVKDLHDATVAGYDVLLILDNAMPSQQSFARFAIAVILLHPRNNMKKLNDLVRWCRGAVLELDPCRCRG